MSTALEQQGNIQIFAVDLDDITLNRVSAAVQGTELRVSPVAWNEVVNHAAVSTDHVIVLLEWTEEAEEECGTLCAAIRRACVGAGCHLVALGGTAAQATLARAMERSVDDVLSRPFGDDLVFRLRRGVRQAQIADAGASPRQALQEALKSDSGGDVVVRAGQITASIHVQDGLILWASVSSLQDSIEEVLKHGGLDIDADLVAAAKDESRSTGAHFMDVLVSWGAVERERAAEALQGFIRHRVQIALDLPGASALFLPKPRPRGERAASDLDTSPSLRSSPSEPPPSTEIELMPRSSRILSAMSPDAVSDIVQRALKLQGALGAAVLDRRTGASMFHAGCAIDTAITWSQLATLAGLGAEGGDVMASAGDRCFVTRPLLGEELLALVVVVSLSETTAGMARVDVAELARPLPARRRERGNSAPPAGK